MLKYPAKDKISVTIYAHVKIKDTLYNTGTNFFICKNDFTNSKALILAIQENKYTL